MATVNIYLMFNGNCKQAFEFYASVFGVEIPYMGTLEEMSPVEGKEISENEKDRIMHVTLPVSKETVIMGSDTSGDWPEKLVAGNNFSVSINAETKDEADRLFNGLSAGGIVTMAMEDTFWGAYFGMFTDKFGIHWMVNYDDPAKMEQYS